MSADSATSSSGGPSAALRQSIANTSASRPDASNGPMRATLVTDRATFGVVVPPSVARSGSQAVSGGSRAAHRPGLARRRPLVFADASHGVDDDGAATPQHD